MLAVHCAYNVRFAHDTDAPVAWFVPEPLAAVFQPANAYPDLVGAVDDNVTLPLVQV